MKLHLLFIGALALSAVTSAVEFSGVEEEEPDGLFNTLSLSFVGNLNFANAVESVSKIADGIVDFISMDMVEALVEVLFSNPWTRKTIDLIRINQLDGPDSRIDYDPADDQGALKDEVVTVFGAILGKEECYERAACVVGWRLRWFAARDIVLLTAKRLVPSLNATAHLIREGAEGEGGLGGCLEYSCRDRDRLPQGPEE